jgi:hypothetical protein
LIAGWLDRLDDNIFSVVLFEIVVIAWRGPANGPKWIAARDIDVVAMPAGAIACDKIELRDLVTVTFARSCELNIKTLIWRSHLILNDQMLFLG